MKSIGQFIAALRKANGMTQKQLAEKLNVSDKAISRWERDECSPDISLIPVIAEIFNVTSDEILRGERINQEDIAAPKSSDKTDKQLERLLNDVRNKFSIRSIIAAGIGGLGLLVAMICNYGFNRAYIGFMAGCIFYLAAVICETIFIKLAFSSVNNSELNEEKVNQCKRDIVNYAMRTFKLLFMLFAITLPLFILPRDTYLGLTFETWVLYGIIYGIIAFAISILASWIVENIIQSKNIYTLSEEDVEKNKQLRGLRKRCVIAFLCIAFVTCGAHNVITNKEPNNFVKGTSFDNFEDFKEYMETPQDYVNIRDDGDTIIYEVVVEDTEGSNEEEYFTHYVYENVDKKLGEYKWINQNVTMIEYDDSSEELDKKYTVYTGYDLHRGNEIRDIINVCFWIAYFLEGIVVAVIYNIKKRKA